MHLDRHARPLRLTSDTHEAATHAEAPFQPTIALDDVFREMVRFEIRNGRLSTWRRRRIVQYAAQLNLSATEAGRLVAECQNEWRAEHEDSAQAHLRLVAAPARGASRFIPVICILLGIGLLLTAWLLS